MRKFLVLILLAFIISLSACSGQEVTVSYTDDVPFELEMKSDTLKILQLTDLHLTYGTDANDRATLNGIETLAKSDDFDLIVITGDMTMSISGPALFKRLITTMESLETPWTFVFGNHETDYSSYGDYLNQINGCEYLYFKSGPELEDGGVGNFRIVFTKDSVQFYTLYMMDSHAERSEYTEEEGIYDYLKYSQVDWANYHLTRDNTDSLFFMHIPLRQYIDPVDYTGTFDEDKVYAQGVDTGLFDVMVSEGKTKGVFVGHDHLNNFEFTRGGILLAYGQITGYNAYGDLNRGGRVIEIDSTGEMTTYILYESEASS